MNLFTKQETKVILIIFTFLFLAIGINMAISLRRGRDSVRKNDISAIQKPLDTYYQKYNVYPLSNESGEIVGCFEIGPEFDAITGEITNEKVCKWGESSFQDMSVLPHDPNSNKGTNYRYVSDGASYTFYVALEGKDEAEYSEVVYSKNLQCGSEICNYSRGVN